MGDSSKGPAPLAGIRVLDLSRVLAGPLATMTLGDLGADVIKVERPGEGDDTRHWGPPFSGDDAAYFLSLNRNKRSVALDLKTPAGVGEVRKLAGEVDVLIENFRPGLMAELGLALEDLRREHPPLVTCSLTAFGDDAAGTATRPGYDIIVQALSGLMSITGERDGEPTKAGVALLDVITGLQATIGIQAALLERARTGRGRHVSVSLFDASVAAMVNQASNYLVGGQVPKAMGSQHPNIVPYQVFHGSDRPFIVAGGNDRLFQRICEVVGSSRVGRGRALRHERGACEPPGRADPHDGRGRSPRGPPAEWLAALEDAAVPCAPIRTMDEVFAGPEGAALIDTVADPARGGALRTVRNPLRFDGEPLAVRRPPPTLGEHTDEVLDG